MYFHYSLQEWYEDWGALAEATETIEKENSREWAADYFRSRYANPLEADWKHDRMLKAIYYLEEHLDSFEADNWLIASKATMTVGKDLVTALFRFFSHATDEQVVNEPPPDIIIRAARECRRSRGKA